jgi:hypothetical protein
MKLENFPLFPHLLNFEYLSNIQDFFSDLWFNLKNRILYFWNKIMIFYQRLLKANLNIINKKVGEDDPFRRNSTY